VSETASRHFGVRRLLICSLPLLALLLWIVALSGADAALH
jgi:hypothetical protein